MRDIDIDLATRGMFGLGEEGMVADVLADNANLMFGDTVKRQEFAAALDETR